MVLELTPCLAIKIMIDDLFIPGLPYDRRLNLLQRYVMFQNRERAAGLFFKNKYGYLPGWMEDIENGDVARIYFCTPAHPWNRNKDPDCQVLHQGSKPVDPQPADCLVSGVAAYYCPNCGTHFDQVVEG